MQRMLHAGSPVVREDRDATVRKGAAWLAVG